jgi:hypothetical protein
VVTVDGGEELSEDTEAGSAPVLLYAGLAAAAVIAAGVAIYVIRSRR